MTANNNLTESVTLSEKGAGGSGREKPTISSTKSAAKQKSSESRKIRKPLMEKKRRARINQSLNELKRILLEANGTPSRKEGNRPAKLEKADILELTVQHLQNLQSNTSPGNPSPTTRVPVTSSTASISDVEVDDESSSSSTSSFVQKSSERNSNSNTKSDTFDVDQKLVRLLRIDRSTAGQGDDSAQTYLIPTRLSNGEIAFVLKRSGRQVTKSVEFSEEATRMEINFNESAEFCFDDHLKSSSHFNDNHNRVYFQDTPTISSSAANIDNDNRIIWRPW